MTPTIKTERYELWLGDCESVLSHLPKSDLLLTDPPYGIGMDGGNVGYKGFNDFERKEWDRITPSNELFDLLLKSSCNQIIWGGNYFSLPCSRSYLIWDKGAGFKNRSYAECEMAWTSYDSNARILKHDPLAAGDYKGKLHPTQKPLAVMAWAIRYALAQSPCVTLIDAFSGSGTSLVAGVQAGLYCIGIEKDPDYFTVMAQRLEATTGQFSPRQFGGLFAETTP